MYIPTQHSIAFVYHHIAPSIAIISCNHQLSVLANIYALTYPHLTIVMNPSKCYVKFLNFKMYNSLLPAFNVFQLGIKNDQISATFDLFLSPGCSLKHCLSNKSAAMLQCSQCVIYLFKFHLESADIFSVQKSVQKIIKQALHICFPIISIIIHAA